MPDRAPEPVKLETPGRTLLVALVVSLACSSLVASAAVLMRPRQEDNRLAEKRRNILSVAGLADGADETADIETLFRGVESRIVDLETGAYVDDVDVESFDPDEAGRRAKRALVYLVRVDGEVDRIILPVRGYGLWSTMYGFLAFEADGITVADITFYAHGETPGLGDFIDDPAWRASWRGKRAYDAAGEPALTVIKGRVPDDHPLAVYQIDGVSGATLTGNGVTRMMAYWLGEHGYGPYLRRVQRGEP